MISNQMFNLLILFIIVFLSIPSTSSTYTVIRKEKDFLTVDIPTCGQYNALGDVQGGRVGCKCANGRGIESKFHALLKNQTPYCFSSSDLGKCRFKVSSINNHILIAIFLSILSIANCKYFQNK